MAPHGWAKVAIAAYDYYEADCIIAEVNNGGDMVEQTLRAIKSTVPIRKVWASRGKTTRAEPISALYAQDKISHLGSFPMLEDEMVQFTSWGIEGDLPSDRVDALVWGFSHLFPSLIVRPTKIKINRPEPSGRRVGTGY